MHNQKFVYLTAQDAFLDLHEHIMDHGETVRRTKELRNVLFTIVDPTRRDITTVGRNFKYHVAVAEFLWYMSANARVDEIGKYIPMWKEIGIQINSHEAQSNYGTRWIKQIPAIVSLLGIDPTSRRAVLSIYNGGRALLDEDPLIFPDVPCTTTIQFFVRDNELDMTVCMRSNDLWWGFCNDQFSFTMLQEMVANELALGVGTYTHFAASLHIYERHWNAVLESTVNMDSPECPYTFKNFWDMLYNQLIYKKKDLVTRPILDGLVDAKPFYNAYLSRKEYQQ